MIRKNLVAAIALLYMGLGLLSFCRVWTLPTSTSELFALSLFPLVGGLLAIYAGLAMFRLSEFGRKLIAILLSIRVVINAFLFLAWLKVGTGSGDSDRFGELIDITGSPYAYQGVLLVWTIIALLIILFLSQKETKEIFVPATTTEAETDRIFE